MSKQVCEHGSLARQCELCERDENIRWLESRMKAQEAESELLVHANIGLWAKLGKAESRVKELEEMAADFAVVSTIVQQMAAYIPMLPGAWTGTVSERLGRLWRAYWATWRSSAGGGMSERDEIALRLLIAMATDANQWVYGTNLEPDSPWPWSVRQAYAGADAYLAVRAVEREEK